jgi:hypothetical protein
MELEEIRARLRRFRGPDDGKGCHLGDGINPGVRALEVADLLFTPEEMWAKFVEHLEVAQPLRSKDPHVNFIGSITAYRKIFMAANSSS